MAALEAKFKLLTSEWGMGMQSNWVDKSRIIWGKPSVSLPIISQSVAW
jgi:hypothetical protein